MCGLDAGNIEIRKDLTFSGMFSSRGTFASRLPAALNARRQRPGAASPAQLIEVASVSRCRATRGWCRVGALSALQKPALPGTMHQTKARPHAPALTWTDLPSVVAVTEGRLRTRKPFIHAVVAVPSVVAVQMSTPRSANPANALPTVPGSWAKAGPHGSTVQPIMMFVRQPMYQKRLDFFDKPVKAAIDKFNPRFRYHMRNILEGKA